MKLTLTTAMLALSGLFALNNPVNAQLNVPAPSPTVQVTQQFATSSIELSYSRPGVKGRKIFGDLVPFDKVWRTGANGATTIKFGEEVTVGGVKLAAGKYGLLTIPGKAEWVIILTKDTTVTNAAAYKQENDVVRMKVKPVKLPSTLETFTIGFDQIKPESCEIIIAWANTRVSFMVSADIDAKIMSQIDIAMKGDKKPYFQAARYYYEHDKDMKKALEWISEAAKERPDAYWILHVKANIQMKLNDYDGAIATAQQSMEKAKADQNDDYVKLNEALIAEANKMKGKK